MKEAVSFGVLGGDRRQAYLAGALAARGYEVYACGLERAGLPPEIKQATLDEVAECCGAVILPIPVTVDGVLLKADFAVQPIPLDDTFAEKMRGKRVFGGMMERLYRTSTVWKEIDAADYGGREEFAVRNAVPTAEGAVGIAMNEWPGTVCGSRCLVAGFGRVGKALAHLLPGMGARVTVAARKPADLAWAESYGLWAVPAAQMGGGEYDLVFNTVPAVLFTRRVLSELKGRPLIVDLASAPGGVDYEAAKNIGVRAILAPSLPGLVAPKAAGEIICDTVCRMLGE